MLTRLPNTRITVTPASDLQCQAGAPYAGPSRTPQHARLRGRALPAAAPASSQWKNELEVLLECVRPGGTGIDPLTRSLSDLQNTRTSPRIGCGLKFVHQPIATPETPPGFERCVRIPPAFALRFARESRMNRLHILLRCLCIGPAMKSHVIVNTS